jgi:dienelactone hydrolase
MFPPRPLLTRPWLKLVALLLAGAMLPAYVFVERRMRALEFLTALSGQGAPTAALVERELVIFGPSGPIRARLYRPSTQQSGPGLVLGHGVHYRGIDEDRLVPFARALARAGNVVLTPELGDISNYRITLDGVDTVEASVDWLSSELSGARVGLLGFSFAGGLSLVAASRPETRDRLSFVGSIGGHHDLERVLHTFVDRRIETKNGLLLLEPHEYGLVVLVYGYLDQLLDAPDRVLMQEVFRTWLHGDRERATALASQRTTKEADHFYELLEQRRLHELGPRLDALLQADRATLRALSPRHRLGSVAAPVYLLHGAGDTVIPPSETEWAELELDGHPHHALVTPLIGHVEVDSSAFGVEHLKLVEFVAALL